MNRFRKKILKHERFPLRPRSMGQVVMTTPGWLSTCHAPVVIYTFIQLHKRLSRLDLSQQHAQTTDQKNQKVDPRNLTMTRGDFQQRLLMTWLAILLASLACLWPTGLAAQRELPTDRLLRS